MLKRIIQFGVGGFAVLIVVALIFGGSDTPEKGTANILNNLNSESTEFQRTNTVDLDLEEIDSLLASPTPTPSPRPSPSPTPTKIIVKPSPSPTPVIKYVAPSPTPKPVTTTTTNCHPSYIGECLDTRFSDYDCIDGSGNGPGYVHTKVRVVGQDIYRLDGNKDGWGCDNL